MSQELDVTNEDAVLAFTQKKRKEIVNAVMSDNKVPDDKLQATLLISALDGMDRAALTSKRIKADEKTANSLSGSAAVVAKLLQEMSSRKNNQVIDVQVSTREIPELGADIPDPDLKPGETEINPKQLDYNSFMRDVQSKSNPSEFADADDAF